jgi:hypothetical protein
MRTGQPVLLFPESRYPIEETKITMTETVSGREYTATRARGFITDWKPRPDTIHLIERVNGVLGTYSAQLPLTIRQIFYVLVGSDEGYSKTEQGYNRLAEALNKARRARLIPFSSIRDDGTQASQPPDNWNSPDHFWYNVGRWAGRYLHDLSDGQPYHTELWVEAGGMVPQAAAVARDYGITVYSAGGFNGLTDKYETAQRLAGQENWSIVLHAGDYDPSGLSILDALAQDVTALATGLGGLTPEFRRVVVTPEQIERYSLPTAPQKGTDRRGEWMDETVQAEALPPDVLAAELRAAIEEVIDDDALQAARDLGETEREQVIATYNRITE